MFAVANYVEAGLWIIIAAAIVALSRRRPAEVRLRALLAAIAFVLFGLSDVIEAQTGAWWRPWWLAVWKGVCITALGALLIRHRMRRGQPGP